MMSVVRGAGWHGLLRGRFTRELPLAVEEPGGPAPEAPLATYAIIAINVLVYLVTSAPTGFWQTTDEWVSRLGFVPAALLATPQLELLKVLTAMFTHANLVHIFFNMYFLYIFGRAVEKTLGRWRYLALYFVSGIAAAVFHTVFMYVVNPAGLAIPSVGASGAISGVLGAYMLLYPGTRLTACFFLGFIPFCFALPAVYYLLFWFAMQVYMGYAFAVSAVAFFAHAGGFVAGMAILPLVVSRTRILLLRMQAATRSLFGLIVFYSPFFYRGRELNPLVKSILAMLILLLLAGSAYAVVDARTKDSYVASYQVKARLSLGGKAYTLVDSFFIRIYGGKGTLMLEATLTDYGAAIAEILARNGLVYNPLLAGKEIMLDRGLTGINIRQTLGYHTVLVGIQPKQFYGLYNENGYLERGELYARLAYRTLIGPVLVGELTANIDLVGAGAAGLVIFALAVVSLAVLIASLYTVLFLDRELVITPE